MSMAALHVVAHTNHGQKEIARPTAASVVSICNILWGDQGPVVQSVVSLTSSLRVISLTVLVDSVYNILIFFAEKM